MKLLTISIAAYNVEEYLPDTLDSLTDERYLSDIEVLVIDDGSKDNTGIIAQKYQERFPETIKYIKKNNGGHGSTINRGIEEATGKYFRVIDGDDWVDKDWFYKYIIELRKCDADMVLTQHTSVSPSNKKINDYIKNIEEGRIYRLDDVSDIETVTLHMMTVKSILLKSQGVRITENCFYVDVEFIVWAIILSNSFVYYKYPNYMYRVGNVNQSINKKNMLKNISMQEIVSMRLLELFNEYNLELSKNKRSLIYRRINKSVGTVMRTYLLLPNKIDSRKAVKLFDKKIGEKSTEFYRLTKGELFYKLIRFNDYSIISLLRFMYRIWCMRYE